MGEERGRIICSHQKCTERGFLWRTDPAPGVPGYGRSHRCPAWFSGSVKGVGEQKIHFLALALPFLACSDHPFCSLPFPRTHRDPQSKRVMMLSRPPQPGCVLGTCPCIARAHRLPGAPGGSGGLQDPNLLSLLGAYKWVAALFMKCWVEGYWGFPFHQRWNLLGFAAFL